MAISRFDQPAEQPILNTYAPLPYEQLMGALKMKQGEQDQALKSLDDSQHLFNLKINKTFVDPLTQQVIANPDYDAYAAKQSEIQQQINDLAGQDLTTGQYRNAVRNIASNTGNFISTKGRGYVSNSDIYNKNMEELQKLDDLNKGSQGRLANLSSTIRNYKGYENSGDFNAENYGKYQDPIERVNKAGEGIKKELTQLDADYRAGKFGFTDKGIEEYKIKRSEITNKKVQDTIINPVTQEFIPVANRIANEEALKLSYQTGINKDQLLNTQINQLSDILPEVANLSPQERSKTYQQYLIDKAIAPIAENAKKFVESEGDFDKNLKFFTDALLKKQEGPIPRQQRSGGFNNNYDGKLNKYKTTDSGKRLSLGELYKEESNKQGTDQGTSYTPGGAKSLAPAVTAIYRFVTGDRGGQVPTSFNDNFELLVNPKGEKLTPEQYKKRSEAFLNNYNNTAIVIDALDPNDPEASNTIKRYNDIYLGEDNNGSGQINGSKVWVINGTDEARPMTKKEISELNSKNVKQKGLSYIGDLNPDNAIIADANKPLERGLAGGHMFGDAENPDLQYIVQANDQITKKPERVLKTKILAGKYFPNEFTIDKDKFLSVPATDYDASGELISTTDPDTGLPFKLYTYKNGKKVKVKDRAVLEKFIQ